MHSHAYSSERGALACVDANRLRAGVHYPRSVGEMRTWFVADEDCLDYLDWIGWPAGFVCPHCELPGGWRLGDGGWRCRSCYRLTAVTAGTLFRPEAQPVDGVVRGVLVVRVGEKRGLGVGAEVHA